MRAVIDVELPRKMTTGSCGYDFYLPEDVVVRDRAKGIYKATVDTGIIMEQGDIPPGCGMFLYPRSSLGTNYGLQLTNSVGVVDSDYRDTIKATIWALDPTLDILRLKKGDRFMQGVIQVCLSIPGEIPPTEIRTGGYGSTGRN